jgi:hypothetical protein
MATTPEFISSAFERAKEIAIQAWENDHHHTVAFAVDIRGRANHVEVTMPDGRRLRSNRDELQRQSA